MSEVRSSHSQLRFILFQLIVDLLAPNVCILGDSQALTVTYAGQTISSWLVETCAGALRAPVAAQELVPDQKLSTAGHPFVRGP